MIGQPEIRKASIFSELLIPGRPITHVHTRVLYQAESTKQVYDSEAYRIRIHNYYEALNSPLS